MTCIIHIVTWPWKLLEACFGGGELGGNLPCKIITTILFCILWIGFILMEFFGRGHGLSIGLANVRVKG